MASPFRYYLIDEGEAVKGTNHKEQAKAAMASGQCIVIDTWEGKAGFATDEFELVEAEAADAWLDEPDNADDDSDEG